MLTRLATLGLSITVAALSSVFVAGCNDTTSPSTAAQYKWGTVVELNSHNPAARAFLGPGWSGAEANLTWTDGHHAELVIPAARPSTDLVFKLNLYTNNLQDHALQVGVNGQSLSKVTLVNSGDYAIKIPKAVAEAKSPLSITFGMPGAVAPSVLKISPDTRTLGIAVRSFVLDEDKTSK